MEQRHVFGPFDGQFANGVVVDHLGNTAERLAELTEDESAVSVDDLHVHEATRTPVTAALGQRQHTRLTHEPQSGFVYSNKKIQFKYIPGWKELNFQDISEAVLNETSVAINMLSSIYFGVFDAAFSSYS